MFMIVCLKGEIVTRQITAPVNARSLRATPMRSRELWMTKMNVAAAGWGAGFYAFRYRGEWHLCSAHQHTTPMKSIDGDMRDAADMWVKHRQEASR